MCELLTGGGIKFVILVGGVFFCRLGWALVWIHRVISCDGGLFMQRKPHSNKQAK